MLILSRKSHESIIINDDIHIEVLVLDSLSVKLGIKAPRHVSVHTAEIYRQIQRKRLYAIGRKKEIFHRSHSII